MSTLKLTPSLLRRLVLEERAKVIAEKKADMGFLDQAITLEPDEFGTDKALEDPQDFTMDETLRKVREIQVIESAERDLIKKLRTLREQKSRAVKRLRK